MKNILGNNLTVTLFGESHGEAIGAVLDGMPAGIKVDEDFIKYQLDLRKPYGKISTPRKETDNFKIISGVFDRFTTGAPICILIPNENTKSADYGELKTKMRPSHADFVAHEKYNGFADFRGGGHFSGRITAALVAAGAILISVLKQKGILIGSHISRLANINDMQFSDFEKEIISLNQKQFAVLDDEIADEMQEKILDAAKMGDSVGGVIETAVIGMPIGVGEPWFDTVEGMLAKALFSVPAVKGVEFGLGFKISDLKGSEANDELYYDGDIVKTRTNNNGGINGGITNGMPIIFKSAIKPTPTISLEQNTIDIKEKVNTVLSARGRHDPCIVHRARVVIDSVTALVISDLLIGKYGADWMAK
ncbi:MAG: chorismate synthase [Clostridia bacterium]|nr:chorismate synthase [Clostridia bacterium]